MLLHANNKTLVRHRIKIPLTNPFPDVFWNICSDRLLTNFDSYQAKPNIINSLPNVLWEHQPLVAFLCSHGEGRGPDGALKAGADVAQHTWPPVHELTPLWTPLCLSVKRGNNHTAGLNVYTCPCKQIQKNPKKEWC